MRYGSRVKRRQCGHVTCHPSSRTTTVAAIDVRRGHPASPDIATRSSYRDLSAKSPRQSDRDFGHNTHWPSGEKCVRLACSRHREDEPAPGAPSSAAHGPFDHHGTAQTSRHATSRQDMWPWTSDTPTRPPGSSSFVCRSHTWRWRAAKCLWWVTRVVGARGLEPLTSCV
jgi:hypothetical protein